MTVLDANKDLIRKYVAALNSHDLGAAAALVVSDLVNHAAIPEAQGVEGMKRILGKLWEAMPDYRSTCEDLLAEGDRVMCRLVVRGTQTGPFKMAHLALPATGRECVTEQIHVFRVAEGKIVEHWAGRDDFGMLRQLGHVPFQGATS